MATPIASSTARIVTVVVAQVRDMPSTLQARHDGIEEVGDSHADDERQQDVVQQPEDQQEDGRRRHPEAPASGRSRLGHASAPAMRDHRACNRHLSASLSSAQAGQRQGALQLLGGAEIFQAQLGAIRLRGCARRRS